MVLPLLGATNSKAVLFVLGKRGTDFSLVLVLGLLPSGAFREHQNIHVVLHHNVMVSAEPIKMGHALLSNVHFELTSGATNGTCDLHANMHYHACAATSRRMVFSFSKALVPAIFQACAATCE